MKLRARAAIVVVGWCVGSLAFADSGAEGRDPERCMVAATPLFEELGAQVVEGRTWFLREGRVASYRHRFRASECVGFFAVGHTGVLDLDLALFTTTGIELGRDVAVDAHPYIRYCGASELDVVAVLHAAKGRGEVRLAVFENAPSQLPELGRRLGRCFASAVGVGTPHVDVGSEPEGPPVDQAYALAGEPVRLAGFQEDASQRSEHDIPTHSRVERNVQLQRGVCYTALAVGGPTVIDLDLAVRDPSGRPVVEDVRRSSTAQASFCPGVAGRFVVDLRMFAGEGRVRSGIFVLQERSGSRPSGVEGLGRIDYVAATRRIQRLGMQQRTVAWGWLAPGLSLSMPYAVKAGRCYAFGAVRSPELARADLDLIVAGERGERLGWNLGSRTPPFVYFCADYDRTVFLEGRVYRGSGRYLVLAGEGS